MNQSVGQRLVCTALLMSGLVGAALNAEAATCRQQKSEAIPHSASYIDDCLPSMDLGTAQQVLRASNIKAPGASDQEIIALARGVKQINDLAGGNFEPIQGVTVDFENCSSYSHQSGAKSIRICRQGGAHAGFTNHLVHELGHVVGNSDGASYYAGYKRTSRCEPTFYSSCSYSAAKDRNEEFADVFALWVGNSSLLDSQGASCNGAMDFMKKHLGAKPPVKCNGSQVISSYTPRASGFTAEPGDDSEPDSLLSLTEGAKSSYSKPSYGAAPWAGMLGSVASIIPSLMASKASPTVMPMTVPTPFKMYVPPPAQLAPNSLPAVR